MKPYVAPAALIERLTAHGLDVGDPAEAEKILRSQSYHRLGGYRYVLRELLPIEEQDPKKRRFRHDDYVQGATLRAACDLAEFDAKLRAVTLQGVLDFELRLRATIGEVLAKRSPLAHITESCLDAAECGKLTEAGETKLEAWRAVCATAQHQHRDDDFVVHHLLTYPEDPDLPVWGLLELLSFGSLSPLLDLMHAKDRQEVANAFGFRHDRTFRVTVRQFADLRNLCAHGARLYNRNLKREVKVPLGVGKTLDHFGTLPAGSMSKLYPAFGLLAYALREHCGGSRWHQTASTQVRKLTNIRIGGAPIQTPEANMGFPDGWAVLPLWK